MKLKWMIWFQFSVIRGQADSARRTLPPLPTSKKPFAGVPLICCRNRLENLQTNKSENPPIGIKRPFFLLGSSGLGCGVFQGHLSFASWTDMNLIKRQWLPWERVNVLISIGQGAREHSLCINEVKRGAKQ